MTDAATSLVLGYTGSRCGMAAAQYAATWVLLKALMRPRRLIGHHGDCLGGDIEFHTMLLALGQSIVVHPPEAGEWRAGCVGSEMRQPAPYLQRDARIALEVEALIGAPRVPRPVRGSGSWYTINCARDLGKPVAIAMPDGSVVYERGFEDLLR